MLGLIIIEWLILVPSESMTLWELRRFQIAEPPTMHPPIIVLWWNNTIAPHWQPLLLSACGGQCVLTHKLCPPVGGSSSSCQTLFQASHPLLLQNPCIPATGGWPWIIYIHPRQRWIAPTAQTGWIGPVGPPKKIVKVSALLFRFVFFLSPWEMAWYGMKQNWRNFPTNPDLANILGDTYSEDFHCWICLDPKFSDFQIPDVQVSRFPNCQNSQFQDSHISKRRRWRQTNSEIQPDPLQRTQGINYIVLSPFFLCQDPDAGLVSI